MVRTLGFHPKNKGSIPFNLIYIFKIEYYYFKILKKSTKIILISKIESLFFIFILFYVFRIKIRWVSKKLIEIFSNKT